jgi:hypothetical protein
LLLQCFRYVHIGPKLCSLLVRPDEADEGSVVGSDNGQYVGLQELWHHLALPPDITIMLCSNGIQQHGALTFPSNMLFVQYGFQVCMLTHITRAWSWKHYFFFQGLHRYRYIVMLVVKEFHHYHYHLLLHHHHDLSVCPPVNTHIMCVTFCFLLCFLTCPPYLLCISHLHS